MYGIEETRRIDLEDWMDGLALDAVIFPAVADVGPEDADINPESADIAWRNGVWVANGNLAIRHLGIPTVTVPMGTMADINMPVGLTFAGHAYSDTALLALACAFEATGPYRTPANEDTMRIALNQMMSADRSVAETTQCAGSRLRWCHDKAGRRV